MDKLNKIKVRYNIILLGIYIIGIILLVQLFNLQIVKGQEYRKQSNTRLTRETTIKAARGNICDRNGNKLVSTKMEFNLELYKTKIDNKTLNQTILDMINILDKNEDTYIDNLPIKVEPFDFIGSDETIQSWKKTNKMQEDLSAEECFYKLKQKYEIIQENVQDARKIMGIRYEISSKGYSSTKTVELAKNISRTSMLEISEKNSNFPGINIVTVPTVAYNSGTLASHILGTVGKITQPELEEKTNYDINDIIGKTGIQYVFEEYLKGKDGIKQIDMAVDGTVTDEYTEKEAVSGSMELNKSSSDQTDTTNTLGTKDDSFVSLTINGGYLSSTKDYAIISQDLGLQLYAKGVVNGILEYYNIENKNAHRADSDTLATAKLFLTIKDKI